MPEHIASSDERLHLKGHAVDLCEQPAMDRALPVTTGSELSLRSGPAKHTARPATTTVTADDVEGSKTFYERALGGRFRPWGPPGFDRMTLVSYGHQQGFTRVLQ